MVRSLSAGTEQSHPLASKLLPRTAAKHNKGKRLCETSALRDIHAKVAVAVSSCSIPRATLRALTKLCSTVGVALVADSCDLGLIWSNEQDTVDVARLSTHVYEGEKFKYAPQSSALWLVRLFAVRCQPVHT